MLPQPIPESLRIVCRFGNVAPAKRLALTKPSQAQLAEAIEADRQVIDQTERVLATYYGYDEDESGS